MPNPITPEMRAALAEVVDDASDVLCYEFELGCRVIARLPQLSALLYALPAVKDSLTADPRSTQYVVVVGGYPEMAGQPLGPGKLVTFPTAPAADHSEDARAMVTVEARCGTGVVADERARFEETMRPNFSYPNAFDRDPSGSYVYTPVSIAWIAWLKRAKAATASAAR